MARKLYDEDIKDIKQQHEYFLEDFESVITDNKDRMYLILDNLEFITALIPEYNNKNFDKVRYVMNSLLDVMATNKFAKSFKMLLESDEIDDFGRFKYPIAETLSVLVDRNIERMSEDTVNIYIWTILKRLWKKEVTELTKNLGITDELALELLIGIPTTPKDMETSQLDRYTTKFKETIRSHSNISSNLDSLGSSSITRLFDFFFYKESKTALHAIGKLLASTMDTNDYINSWGGPVYIQFTKSLYRIMNTYDVSEIMHSINYIVKQNTYYDQKHLPRANFDIEIAYNYPNIKNAIKAVLDKNPDAKKYL